MKVLVTGGAGFVGSHLAEELAEKNDVAVFDNFSSGRMEFLHGASAKVVLGDITDLQAIKSACNEADSVYHFAVDPDVRSLREPLENFRVDVLGTLNTLEWCRLNDVRHVVFASSSVVDGNAEIPTSEEAPIASVSNYAAAKVASECYVTTYSQLYGLKATILRYANIIGPD